MNRRKTTRCSVRHDDRLPEAGGGAVKKNVSGFKIDDRRIRNIVNAEGGRAKKKNPVRSCNPDRVLSLCSGRCCNGFGFRRVRDAAFFNARIFAAFLPQIIQFGATHFALAHDFDLGDIRRMQRENAFHSDAE